MQIERSAISESVVNNYASDAYCCSYHDKSVWHRHRFWSCSFVMDGVCLFTDCFLVITNPDLRISNSDKSSIQPKPSPCKPESPRIMQGTQEVSKYKFARIVSCAPYVIAPRTSFATSNSRNSHLQTNLPCCVSLTHCRRNYS